VRKNGVTLIDEGIIKVSIGGIVLDKIDKEKYYSSLFLSLVLNFQAAAWQQMGKIKNPLTDKIERNLEQAKASIDLIDMLAVKTANNLDENEKKLIDRILSELKMNYLDEIKKEPPKKAPEQEQTGAEEKSSEESK
jgi:hypothetical protein